MSNGSNIISAGISAVGGIIGGIGGSVLGSLSSQKQAKDQRRFIERMRATAYQATMADMRAAGLNPILAYKTGPTPIGSAAMGMTPDFGQAIASGVTSAARAAKVGLERKQIRATTAKTKREALRTEFQARIEAEKFNARAITGNILANTRETTAKAQLLEAQIPRAETIKHLDESKAGQFINIGATGVARATGAALGRKP